MSLPAPLNVAPRLLLGPGPCDAHPNVLRALATPLLGHLDPQYLKVMDEIQDMLRATFQTSNALTFPISGTGMSGPAIQPLRPSKARVLVPIDSRTTIVCCAGALLKSSIGTFSNEVSKPA